MPRGGLPDRWLDYRSVGKRLDGTRFIAFKVPLKQALNRPLPRSDVFGPWELLETLRFDNQELGLIIDLTNTTRYYNLQDMPNWLLFVKIFTRGHEIPSDTTILSFKRTVRRFLRENAENDKLIGVHCTHGLNRTGYLICRYLIDVDRMDPKHAIDLFNSSRGHDIERENYLSDLQCGPKRSNKGIDEFETEPQRGGATHRPSDAAADCYDREDRRAPCGDSWDYRSSSRGLSHRPHHGPPHDALRPDPRFQPPPHHQPTRAPPQPYRWTPAPPSRQWRGPPRPEESRFRPDQPDPRWRQGQQPRPVSRYTPRWSNQPN
ncbi:RNA/RNP complex-1-interacting phosphatase isoform X2 [Hippoglossus hippoglossus]|uniref:RNA/RNP complex-1-interacting phosphatase isoform X2 n=1 Tax=Hippoglossus hippoglossus TaxID=8267 RepID=UPI00148DD085|nr:RNA/RNP complex-1-interacting phosphatase isoform X2 [Hippoglossus hippoglossus]